jgi:hypothetical protein
LLMAKYGLLHRVAEFCRRRPPDLLSIPTTPRFAAKEDADSSF